MLYGTAAIADALIAGTMVYYLRKKRSGVERFSAARSRWERKYAQ